MNAILIKNVRIADSQSDLNGELTDLLIEDGIIKKIGLGLDFAEEFTIDLSGAYASPGWIDMLSFCGEPGEEFKEDFDSLAQAAVHGGFTQICVLPGPQPLPDNGHAIKSIRNLKNTYDVDFLPLGFSTHAGEGIEMSEIYDLQKEGAVGYFDGDKPLKNNGVKQRLIQYTAHQPSILYLFSFDTHLANGGLMHEGTVSTSLGMKGISSVSEYLPLQQDIFIVEFESGKVHFPRISCKESIDLMREAKAKGLKVYGSVPAANLCYTDKELETFDSKFKLLPPLRTHEDRQALIKGLLDGSIDAICSNHVPQDIESKDLEFEYAQYGAATIEHVLSLIIDGLGNLLEPDLLSDWLHYGPKRILNTQADHIVEGAKANITFFDLDDKTDVISYSKAFNQLHPVNKKGNIRGIINGLKNTLTRKTTISI